MKSLRLVALLMFATPFIAGAQQQLPDREQHRAAFEACLQENGLALPQPGQRPSEEDRSKIESCMTAKGFSRPPGPPHGQRGFRPDRSQDQNGAQSAR